MSVRTKGKGTDCICWQNTNINIYHYRSSRMITHKNQCVWIEIVNINMCMKK